MSGSVPGGLCRQVAWQQRPVGQGPRLGALIREWASGEDLVVVYTLDGVGVPPMVTRLGHRAKRLVGPAVTPASADTPGVDFVVVGEDGAMCRLSADESWQPLSALQAPGVVAVTIALVQPVVSLCPRRPLPLYMPFFRVPIVAPQLFGRLLRT